MAAGVSFYQNGIVMYVVSSSCLDCGCIDKWLIRNGVEWGRKYNLLLI